MHDNTSMFLQRLAKNTLISALRGFALCPPGCGVVPALIHSAERSADAIKQLVEGYTAVASPYPAAAASTTVSTALSAGETAPSERIAHQFVDSIAESINR